MVALCCTFSRKGVRDLEIKLDFPVGGAFRLAVGRVLVPLWAQRPRVLKQRSMRGERQTSTRGRALLRLF